MSELDLYLGNIDALIKKLEPAQANRALREIATELRKRNQARIKANTDPEGKAFASRQPDKSQLRKLKPNQQLRPRQTFAYMKMRGLKLAFVRDEGNHLVGRLDGTKEMVGLRKDFIRLKTNSKNHQRLFKKIHQARWLKARVTGGQAAIGFMHGFVSKIASQQHHGLSKIRLPSRLLLGMSNDDLDYIEEVLLKYLESK